MNRLMTFQETALILSQQPASKPRTAPPASRFIGFMTTLEARRLTERAAGTGALHIIRRRRPPIQEFVKCCRPADPILKALRGSLLETSRRHAVKNHWLAPLV